MRKITIEQSVIRADDMLTWMRNCEAMLVEYPNDEQLLQELECAAYLYKWCIDHPADEIPLGEVVQHETNS